MADPQKITFPENEYDVRPVVIVTSDVDCDGIGYGYHRVFVPLALATSARAAAWFSVQTEQMSGYGDVSQVMEETKFREQYWETMSEFDRSYWEEIGYMGRLHRR